jgi:hypothetical protein
MDVPVPGLIAFRGVSRGARRFGRRAGLLLPLLLLSLGTFRPRSALLLPLSPLPLRGVGRRLLLLRLAGLLLLLSLLSGGSLLFLLSLLGPLGTVAVAAAFIASFALLSAALLLLLRLLRLLRLSAPGVLFRAALLLRLRAFLRPLSAAAARACPPVILQVFDGQAHLHRARPKSEEPLVPLVQYFDFVHFVQFNAQFLEGVLHGFLAGFPACFNCFH